MQEMTDMELLEQYVRRNAEEAFTVLVKRHVNMVYSVALRKTGKPDAAEEIAQAVFVILAKKAPALNSRTILSGWLYHTARLTAASFFRRERRRACREHEAFMHSLPSEPESEVWPQIMPLLEDAMGQLGEKDRNAIALRFFERKSFQEIGVAVGATENAAKKRVAYALEKLRKFFARRGVVSTTAIIAGAMAANSVHAAPAALATSVAAIAATKGATAGASILTLIQGALKLMAWSKAKTAIVVGAGVLLAAGTATVTVRKIAAHSNAHAWQSENIQSAQVAQAPPLALILPTKFPDSKSSRMVGDRPSADAKFVGIRVQAAGIIQVAFKWFQPARIVFTGAEPQGYYDFISTLPEGSSEALQRELKNRLGLSGHKETRETDVLRLRVKSRTAPGIKAPVPGGPFFMNNNNDIMRIKWADQPIPRLTEFLEKCLDTPVVDQTGLTEHCSIDITWPERGAADLNHNALKQVLLSQLGLELVPGRESIEVLVIDKAD